MNKDFNLESASFKTRQGLLQLRFSLVPPGKFQDNISNMATDISSNFLNAFLINQHVLHRYQRSGLITSLNNPQKNTPIHSTSPGINFYRINSACISRMVHSLSGSRQALFKSLPLACYMNGLNNLPLYYCTILISGKH
jgi:hypothetical protein